MFTGIIECVGTITEKQVSGTNIIFSIASEISSSLKVDQSVSHNGVCLTVTHVANQQHQVTAIQETLQVTSLKNWQSGQKINLERAMMAGQRLDGHIVQGHVDVVAQIQSIASQNGSYIFSFLIAEKYKKYIVHKGSVCIDGVSLTVANDADNVFQVAIIPYTFEHTIFKYYQVHQMVNIEFDIFGKYFEKYFEQMVKERLKSF